MRPENVYWNGVVQFLPLSELIAVTYVSDEAMVEMGRLAGFCLSPMAASGRLNPQSLAASNQKHIAEISESKFL